MRIKRNRFYKSIHNLYYRLNLLLNNPRDIKYFKKIICDKVDEGIIVVSHESNFKGASFLALNVAKELKSQGRNVIILSRQLGNLDSYYSEVAPFQVFYTKRQFKKTLSYFREKGYGKIILNTVINGDLVDIAKQLNYTTICLLHETVIAIQLYMAKKYIIEILNKADFVVFPTKILKREITLEYGDCVNKSIVLPQGLYFSEIKHMNKLTERPKNILAIGNTSYVKGFDVFVQIASLFINEIDFLWAGPKEAFFDTVKNEIGLPDNFHYVGIKTPSELNQLYNNSRLYLLTSRFDTFPSVLLESMASGTPVLGNSESGGIIEIIKDNSNGYLVNGIDNIYKYEEIIRCYFDLNDMSLTQMSDMCISISKLYNFSLYVDNLYNLK